MSLSQPRPNPKWQRNGEERLTQGSFISCLRHSAFEFSPGSTSFSQVLGKNNRLEDLLRDVKGCVWKWHAALPTTSRWPTLGAKVPFICRVIGKGRDVYPPQLVPPLCPRQQITLYESPVANLSWPHEFLRVSSAALLVSSFQTQVQTPQRGPDSSD